MNRKLHNTILAFSISSGFLMLGLMAAVPLPDGQAPRQAGAAMVPGATVPAGTASQRAIEARTLAYEADMARAADTGEMIALSSSFLAAVATEAALAAVLQDPRAAAPGERAAAAEPAPPRRANRRRSALAMPYFSFAHGLRGGSGS
ncbi:hypothetical protein QFW77_09375 [Luteimonas sp. RD2P54]|uniref:Uncharacterized protein n=1 Tax=Luteimonas endophytica TaxID=3042023 RepID=A0ABT6J8Q4_9GAMM|nr:hypothetical protein [Luteimonas endophytica]MDH5823196.1 hypothetical protein [Luteimonas endophytica]